MRWLALLVLPVLATAFAAPAAVAPVERREPVTIDSPPPRPPAIGDLGGPAAATVPRPAAAPEPSARAPADPRVLRIDVTAEGPRIDGVPLDGSALLARLRTHADADRKETGPGRASRRSVVLAGAADLPWKHLRLPLVRCVHPDVRISRISLLVADTGARVRIDVPEDRLGLPFGYHWEETAQIEVSRRKVTAERSALSIFDAPMPHGERGRSALAELARIGEPELLPECMEVVDGRMVQVVPDSWAVRSLRDLGPRVVPDIAAALADPCQARRPEILTVLAERREDSAVARDAVLRAMADADEALALDAARAVAKWEGWRDRALPHLRWFAAHADKSLAARAREALGDKAGPR
jgi:hypothetical protein